MDYHPHEYQQACTEAIRTKPCVALWLEMGMGKTVITLTAIEQLLHDDYDAQRVLIVAPKKVAEATWQDEAARWSHTSGLRIATVLGTARQRLAALRQPADIYITNRDNVPWLVDHYGRRWPFDMVVLDEATSFKNHNAQRFKALRRVRGRIRRVVELTGSPAPNNYLDLWAQIYLLDQGERLGRYYTHYRQRFFQPDKRDATRVFSWRPRPGAEREIEAAIADVCLSLRAKDHLQMQPLITEDIPVVLDDAAAQAYRTLEAQCLLEVDGETITARQAAVLTGKLLQLCNGGLYDAAHHAHPVHRCKLQAFNELIDALDGQKCLVFYGFEFDASNLLSELQSAHRGLSARVLRSAEDARAWNAGEVDVLLAQPASSAYGLNLQQGGHHIVWYSLPWSLELYTQGTARLYRQGQVQPVIAHRLIVKGGADELVAAALSRKDDCQSALLEGLKARIKRARDGA